MRSDDRIPRHDNLSSDVPHLSFMKGRIPINYHPHPASPATGDPCIKGEGNSGCSHKRWGTSDLSFSLLPFLALFILYLLYSGLFLTGCALHPPEPCIKDGHVYGVTDDWIVSGDWDSCYRRAISYAQGGCRDQAKAQFLQAIRQRVDDQWRARSYGMHVLDEYFPHRELGILSLQQGKLEEAIEELSLSLASADSAKAKYYLNQARRRWLEKTGLDHAPPLLHWTGTGTGTVAGVGTGSRSGEGAGNRRGDSKEGEEIVYTNSSTYQIRGQARDDFFVSSILVNDQALFLDLAQPVITFRKEITLKQGLNRFSWRVTDLVGHEHHEEVQVLLDQQGPIVILRLAQTLENQTQDHMGNHRQRSSDDQVDQVPGTERRVAVKGLIFDAGGLDTLLIAGEKVPLVRGEKMREFQLDISFVALATRPTFKASDLAGNVTAGNVTAGNVTAGDVAAGDVPRLWNSDAAWDTEAATEAALELAANDETFVPGPPIRRRWYQPSAKAPRITIEKYPSLVFQPVAVIQGWVESTSEITGLWVNEEPVLSSRDAAGIVQTLRRLWYGGRTFIYFTRIIEGLKEGKNHLTIRASDGKGKSSSQKITVEYQIREVDRIGNRWQLAILPFKVYALDSPGQPFLAAPPPATLASLGDKLHQVFCQTQRFFLLERERIDAVIHELGLQVSALADKTTGPDLGRLLAAEVLLIGSVREEWDGQERCLEVVARLVDVETSQELVVKSVYNRWQTIRDEQYLLSGLARIFQEEFPLVQGKVVDKNRKAFGISLSAADLIKQGMKVLVYRPDGENRAGEEKPAGKERQAEGQATGEDRAEEHTAILGEGRVDEVTQHSSLALPSAQELLKTIEIGDLVITK